MRRQKQYQSNSIEDYFSTKKTKFWTLLKSTGKWKELFNQTESIFAIILSIVFVCILYIIYHNTSFTVFNEMLLDIMRLLISASAGMLGFIISGLAIFTGTITNKLVKNINSDEKIDGLIGILFSFYFIGAIIGSAIIVYLIFFLLLWSELNFSFCAFLMGAIVVSYLFVFSVLYSVTLLGTCIRIFLVSYKYYDVK